MYRSILIYIMDITLNVKSAVIEAYGYRQVSVELVDVDNDEVMNNFTIEQFVNKFGLSEVLDFIGSDECKEHFELTEIVDED